MFDYSKVDLVNNPKNPIDNTNYKPNYTNLVDPGKINLRGNVQVGGTTDYGSSQYDNNTPLSTLGNVDIQRAEQQPWYDQLGNALTQAVVGEIVGGTIEGLGYVLDIGSVADIIQGKETEWGNFITEFGQSIREGTEEATRIYEDPTREPGFWNGMGDPGWWFKNSVSVASTLSMLIPSAAAVKTASFLGKSLSKGARVINKSLDFAEKMSVRGKWMTEGISQAVVSRNIENWMEAHGTFEDLKQQRLNQINPKTGKNYTEEEATLDASRAAAENYRNGWAMLLQDIPQYLALGKVFNPVTKKMENALGDAARKGLTANLKPWQQKTVTGLGTFLSEGGEEAYQFLISERAKLASDLKSGLITQDEFDKKMSEAYGSEEMMTSAFFGGLGGNLFQFAGKGVNQAFKSKSRKEYEENIGKTYDAKLKSQAAYLAAMQQELAKADQDGMSDARKEIIDNIMLNMTAQSLERDKYDSFIETIKSMENMSEEDIANFNEISEQEFDKELAKQYTPDILKRAEDMKKIYLKHRNKNLSPTLSAELSRLEVENKRWAEKKKANSGVVQELRDLLDSGSVIKASEREIADWNRKEDRLVYQRRIKALQREKDNTESKEIKSFIDKAIKVNKAKLNAVKRDIYKADKELKNMTPQEKETYENRKEGNEIAREAYGLVKDDILRAKEIQASFDDRITVNNARMAHLKSDEGKLKFNKAQLEHRIENATNEDEIKQNIEDLEKNDIFTEEEKKEYKKVLEDRLKKVQHEKKVNEAKKKADKIKAEQESKINEKNSDPSIPDNNVTTKVTESLEDEHRDEQVDFESKIMDAQEKALKTKVTSKTISPLDTVGSPAFNEWRLDNTNKIDTEVTYKISTKGPHMSKAGENSKEAIAIKAFNQAKKSGTPIPQHVYDNLPIQVYFGKGDKIYTFLPSYPGDSASGKMIQNYVNGTKDERERIIDAMYRGEVPKSKVVATGGGELQTQMDENGVVAENNVKDLKQIKEGKTPIHIVYTDLDGVMMEMNKEDRNEEFNGTIYTVGNDKDGTKRPYKGGVFLILKKADGTPFPVRLNFLKNTPEQADLLADILIDIAVPPQRGAAKKLSLSTPLSLIEPGLQGRIKEIMGPELAVLGKDPILNDIINMFIYVSDETKGLKSELYFDGPSIKFGEGNTVDLNNRDKKDLVDFLTNVKRRQFSIAMWNDTAKYKGYRDFVFDNKILNTNVVVGEPEFQSSKRDPKTGKVERRVQMYIGLIENKSVPKSDKVVSGTNNLQSQDSIIKEKKGPSEKEINDAIQAAFPGKAYIAPKDVEENGVTVMKTALGVVVPESDAAQIRKIRQDMTNESKSSDKNQESKSIDSGKDSSLQKRMTEKLPKIAKSTAKKYVPKELVKTRIATQFIGQGKTDSSTDRYRKMYDEEGVANTGEYTKEDIIFVASNGNRGGAFVPVKDGVLQGEYKNIDKAIEAGASIIMDTREHLKKTKKYNTGEIALATYLSKNGYEMQGDSGLWSPAAQKTQSKNVTVSPSKGKSPQPNAIVAYRTKGTSEKNMIEALKDNVVGNPFGPYGEIKESEVIASIRFLTWLEGNSDTDIMQDYRKAIIDKGLELRGKEIYYYKELGRLSHANFLDYFLNESNFLDKYHSQKSSDANIGKTDKKDVSSQPARTKSPKSRRRLGGGKIQRGRKNIIQKDNNIKPKDDEGKIDQECPF